ncbi:MAG: ABC transporter permease [Acidobacteria bacterium]|nr:ABC transporter permease [Acidobacteriota bacterium]
MKSLRQVLESLRIGFDSLRANKARGVLTALGIIIGIVAVITTMTAANGLSNNFKESVSALGSDVLYVSRMPWIVTGNFFEFRNRPNLTLEEAELLARRMRSARAVNPTINTSKSIKYRSEVIENVEILGTTDQQMLVASAVPEIGRFLTRFDIRFNKSVCVIGSTVRERLFENVDPLNKTMKIGRRRFRVVGVMEKQGSAAFFGGPDFDSQVFVPITSFVKAFGGSHRDINVAVKAPSQASLADFEFELIGEMRKIRKLRPSDRDNFSINQMDSLVGMFNSVMGVVVTIGLVITTISLFVGGIGVMNIMYVSVTERTKEIGIRKAIGAKRRAILAQFLFESMAICAFGGLVGLAGAFGVTALIDRLVMPATISPGIATLAVVISMGIGVLFGFLPAWKASRLNPIEALRYE